MSNTIHLIIFDKDCAVWMVLAQKSQKQQGDKVLSSLAANNGDWHWRRLCVTEQTPPLFSFTVTDDCLTFFWVVLWHCKQFRWLVGLSHQRPYKVHCSNVMAIHFTAIWSGWVHRKPECNKMHAGSSVIRYRMSAVRRYGRASQRCQM